MNRRQAKKWRQNQPPEGINIIIDLMQPLHPWTLRKFIPPIPRWRQKLKVIKKSRSGK